MVDFRRMIPVLAVIAFLLGSAVTASAQVTQGLTCLPNGGVPTPARSEGLTELVGDLVVTCSGGVPTPFGSPIPTVNIQVFLNTSLTSRLLANTSGQFTEALLMLDEPIPGAQFPCATANGICAGVGNGVGTSNPLIVGAGPYYGGGTVGTVGNNRNIFQGLLTASNSVTFLGIPIDPPGTLGQRVIRITNVRANANALGVAGANATPTPIIETITATPAQFFPVSNPSQTVAFIQRGLLFSVGSSATSTAVFTVAPNQQCVTRTETNLVATLRYTELFATAFKKRIIGSSDTNPSAGPPPQQDNLAVGTYNTESGFVHSGLVYPSSVPVTPGLADFGTRLKAVFNNVPTGVSLFVQTTASGINAQGTTAATPDRARCVTSEAGAYAPCTASTGTGTPATPSLLLTTTNNSATVVWEVTESDPLTFTTLAFNVWATYTASPATNSPALGTTSVNGSYAPTSTVTTSAASPVPRFADTSTANNIFSITACVTNLLFPYVTSQFGFDTGLAISATSADPFGTALQSGTCTLNWYGAAFTGATPTPNVLAGTTYTTLLSSTLNNVTGGFTGYMIAQCRFQFAHGFAFISDLGARNLAMGYLALIIPEQSTRAPSPFTVPGANSGEQLAN